MKRYLGIAAVTVLIALFVIFVHSRLLGRVPDTDAFYHIRHAWIYQTEGVLQNAFPWAQYSVINKYSSDIWYGFHISIIPFTYFKDLLNGMGIGSRFVTAASLILAFAALKRLKVKWPIFWLLIFAITSADLLYRLTMLRPHPLSLGLALLLFAFLQKQSENESFANKKTLLAVFVVSLAFSWIHLSLSWLPILVLLTTLLPEILQKQGMDWKKGLAVIVGLAAGLFLRPNPLGAAKLAYIQVVQLLFEKQGEVPLRFGRELTPFFFENFADQLIPITILLLISALLFIWKRKIITKRINTAIISSAILSLIFFILTFAVARRSNEVFIGFGILFTALVFTHVFPLLNKRSWQYSIAAIAAIVAIIYMPIKTIYRFDTYVANAFEPHRFEDLANWLKENTQPGEVVFNIHWDRFAQLFFWNYSNYYINGMDPIFQYAFDPSLYWKTHFFAIDAASAFTCGKVRCTAEEVENTPLVLKRDFKVNYLMAEKLRSPKFYEYIDGAREFKKVFENEQEALFKLL